MSILMQGVEITALFDTGSDMSAVREDAYGSCFSKNQLEGDRTFLRELGWGGTLQSLP